jgi:APA family basic amino acid/polyamine antiporter
MSIFMRKPVARILDEHEHGGGATLPRVLSRSNLVLLGVGAVVGTGIFVLTGQAAAAHAGPAIVLSMVIAGLVSALAALCYSEFATSVPIAGSAYTYAYATLGEFVAWIIGWDLILEYALGAATVAVGWSGNLVTLLRQFGIQFPPALSAAPGTSIGLAAGGTVTAVFNLPAVIITILVTILLVIGIKESATVNNVVVIIKVGVVMLVIAAGAIFFNAGNFVPFVPENTGTFGEYGVSGILRGAAVIFFAYIGFDAVSTSAQEAKDPQRDMPFGIIGSLAICTILYVLVSAAMISLVPYQEMRNQPAPLVIAVEAAERSAAGTTWAWPMSVLRILVTLGALAGLTSVMLVMLMAQPRIFLAMARDGLLPPCAARLHPRFRTPHVTTIRPGGAVGVAAGFSTIGARGALVNIGTLLAFVIVAIGIIFMRRREPDAPRPFSVPLVPWIPLLSALVSLVLMASLPWESWERLLIWMGIGIVVYFAYGYRHSRLRGSDITTQRAAGDSRHLPESHA